MTVGSKRAFPESGLEAPRSGAIRALRRKNQKMKRIMVTICAALIAGLSFEPAALGAERSEPLIVDHLCVSLEEIPRQAVQDAIDNLVIAYGHTSHGSQLVTGMDSLPVFLGDDLYMWSYDGANGTLELRDKAMPYDLGYASWEPDTRAYLDSHPEVNVVIWAWCGQLIYATEEFVNEYLANMSALEVDYPNVSFVYMTDHLNGWTYDSNSFQRNRQIREYCTANNKILYDFHDIESYDPDGEYYADRLANDNCDYDSDGDGTLEIGVDANWAIDWQSANPDEWYECPAAHTQPLNANLKAYAAWWLWARLAGWPGPQVASDDGPDGPAAELALSCHPNPFNPTTTITFSLAAAVRTRLEIYDAAGRWSRTLVDKVLPAGPHQVLWDGRGRSGERLNSGVYFCRITAGDLSTSRKLVLLR